MIPNKRKGQDPQLREREIGWANLAEKLGVSRQTVSNWRKIEGTPQTSDWQAWTEWVSLNKAEENLDLTEAKRLVELEKLRKMRRENQIQEGNTIPMDEVVAALRVATAKWDSVLTSKLDQEAPARLVGKSIAEIRAEMALIHDELREAIERELTFKPVAQ